MIIYVTNAKCQKLNGVSSLFMLIVLYILYTCHVRYLYKEKRTKKRRDAVKMWKVKLNVHFYVLTDIR